MLTLRLQKLMDHGHSHFYYTFNGSPTVYCGLRIVLLRPQYTVQRRGNALMLLSAHAVHIMLIQNKTTTPRPLGGSSLDPIPKELQSSLLMVRMWCDFSAT